MQKENLLHKKIAPNPGVYFFLGKKKEILYIGKATSLKQRIKSYFDLNIKEKRSAVIEKMVHEAKTIEWTETDSVLEALLLETNLIRTHRPTYNTRSKDDKSYNHVVITNEDFPRVLIVRGKDLLNIGESSVQAVYGPFPNGTMLKEALKIIRKLFQFYDTKVSIDSSRSKMQKGKIDFNRQIGLYPSACTRDVYAETIKHIKFLFEGKKHAIIAELEKHMMHHAKREEFEQAQLYKKKIFALKHIHDIALLKDESRIYQDERTFRIEAYDVAHLSGQNVVGVMTVIIGGEIVKTEYRKFHIKTFSGVDDTRALAEILERRLAHTEWSLPNLIVVDGSTAQRNRVLAVLKQCNVSIPVVGVVKDEKHNPKRIIGPQSIATAHKQAILLANAEAHRFAITFHRLKRNKKLLS